jgi:serine O-acetyltransferase
MKMLELIKKDVVNKARRFYGSSNLKDILRVLVADGSSAMLLYRLQQALVRKKLTPLALGPIWLNKVVNGCVIGASADFGPGFLIMHGQGVVINGSVSGDDNITVESGVVIGARKPGLPVKALRIESGVFFGSGAKVLGDIVVGEKARIGANAVVLKDVPPGFTALGIPAQNIPPPQRQRIKDQKTRGDAC